MKPTILIIDDDKKLNLLLKEYLADFGFHVISEVHPANGLKKLRELSPDMVILDIMLPDQNGFEICKIIRGESRVPVIMLTARGELMDKVVGLELGADDYIPKPFEPRELVARIQSVLRRSSRTHDSDIQEFGSLIIDFSGQSAMMDGEPITLTTNEFAALSLLSRFPGKVLDRDTILQELRGFDCEAFNRSVDITMSRLRQKLGDDPKSPRFIKTVWGAGYVFIAGKRSDGNNETP